MRSFDYRLFGLHLRSELELPELVAAAPSATPDVTIATGLSHRVTAGAGTKPLDGGTLLTIDGVAEYAVTGGKRIVVHRRGGAGEHEVRGFLLGSAMGMLIHQRGLLPLHANAVAIGGRAVAFSGCSGAGKSTLAAWFHDRGYPLVADDVCVVRFDADRRPIVSPGIPRLRLWRDGLEASGRDPALYARSFGDARYDKYDVPVAAAEQASENLQLAAVYVLGQGEAARIERLAGIAAAEALFAHTYRGQYVGLSDTAAAHMTACMRLMACTPVFRMDRCWGLDRMDEQGEQILDHVLGVLGEQARAA